MRTAAGLALMVALIASSLATAETWRTGQPVVLRKRPGEKADAVAKLEAGTVVVVERSEGRWLRVRAGRAVGYLARTTLTGGPSRPAGPTRKWSADRRQDPKHRGRRAEGPAAPAEAITELFVEVTASSALRQDARPDAGVVADVAEGARLAVIEAPTAAWVHARDDRGRTGWIARDRVGDGAAAVAVTRDAAPAGAEAVAESAPETPAAPERGFSLRAGAALGYRSLGMDFTSSAGTGLGNYLVSADATAAVVELDAAKRLSGRARLGLDARAQVSRSWSGIAYDGPTGRPGSIAFSTVAADVGIRVGARLRRGLELSVRGGGHYDAFVVEDVDNSGMLPRERLLGATLGARADLVPPGSRIGATLRIDGLIVGTRRQTPGLEDGTASTARALWAGVTFRIRLARRLALLAAYEFGRATTRWSGMSNRDPGITSAHRVDATQLVHVGLAADL